VNVHVLKQDRRTMHATCPPCRRTVARGCAGKCKYVKENNKTKYIIIHRLNSENVIKRSWECIRIDSDDDVQVGNRMFMLTIWGILLKANAVSVFFAKNS
jgi:hypothetical protein